MTCNYTNVNLSYILSAKIIADSEKGLLIDDESNFVIGFFEKKNRDLRVFIRFLEYYNNNNNIVKPLSMDVERYFNRKNIIYKDKEVLMLTDRSTCTYVSIGNIFNNQVDLHIPLIAIKNADIPISHKGI